MPDPAGGAKPRTFFLNEQHELTRGEMAGGGRTPKYTGINWAEKGQHISRSLSAVKKELHRSKDPVRDQHYFILAKPLHVIRKKSENKRIAPKGTVEQKVSFADDDSRVFRKLGLDLIQIFQDGTASVHAKPENLDQLAATSHLLDKASAREQARWATIESFGPIPYELRIEQTWMKSLKPGEIADAVVELQPLLGRPEIEAVMKAIAGILKRQAGELIKGLGTDFSGRQWLRAKLTKSSLLDVAKEFFSVQSLHSPLLSAAFLASPSRGRPASAPRDLEPEDIEALPSVAILDTGVPSDHSVLNRFRRGGYNHPDSFGRPVGDHGSLVASRIVFGDPDRDAIMNGALTGRCRFYDALVATSTRDIDDKAVAAAIEAIVATAPDVRVFNLSFDCAATWSAMDPVRQREYLSLVQDLDNLIFARDIVVIVAAGNSLGVPKTAYPGHLDEPEWALGPWARTFNALTCGSFVDRLTPGGLVTNLGWPSPFTRVGPGLCESPKPDFSAHGGNSDSAYTSARGHGVWCYNAAGLAEDHSGTSFAAPLLAREAAFAFQSLQAVCEQGARPFASTVKAFLALTATEHGLGGSVRTLADRTLGMGRGSAARLSLPRPDSAVLVWQGILNGPDDIARVQLPIPLTWFQHAEKPILRLVLAWDSPANAAVTGTWACRNVTARLRPAPEAQGVHGSRRTHHSYPLVEKDFDLKRSVEKRDIKVEGDQWLLEIFYEQTAEYYAGIDFAPQQRVSFAAELFDAGAKRVSPQLALQRLAIAPTMQRLSVPPAIARTPVIIKSPG